MGVNVLTTPSKSKTDHSHLSESTRWAKSKCAV